VLARAGHLPLDCTAFAAEDGGPLAFEHLDRAIERAEDLLLASLAPEPVVPQPPGSATGFGFLDLLQPEHRTTLASLMQVRHFGRGDHVITKGDPGNELFLVREGRFTTTIELRGGDGRLYESRLATFEPGMCFGEIAFLSGQTRTANVTADVEGSCWVLTRADFDLLRRWEPDAVTELLLALTRDLGQKLALTSYQLTLMEHL
jgi:glutaminase